MIRRLLSKLACALGMHGPNYFGPEDSHRSVRSAPFERTCGRCGAVWHGRQVYTPTIRTIGDWRRVK